MPNVLIVIEQDIFKKQFADKELKKKYVSTRFGKNNRTQSSGM